MGTPWDPDDPPYEFSENDCPTCTPDLWPEGKTAKYVVATFTGIVKCPQDPCPICPDPPNGQPFICEQDTINPCRWIYDNGTWSVIWTVNVGGGASSRLLLTYMPMLQIYFQGDKPNPCETNFTGKVWCAAGYCGKEGTGVVT